MKTGISITIIAAAIIAAAFITNDKAPVSAAELGKLLFFDAVLSKNYTISCASCHKPGFAFADTASVSTGVYGRKGHRNTPTVMNVLLRRPFFWDGRSATLEDQALAPIQNPDEMDLPVDSAVQRLNVHKQYRDWFAAIFKSRPTKENLALAIAAFEKTLETSDSPFDNWKFSGDTSVISDVARRGFVLFNGKGKCNQCHFGADFTQNDFRNIGLFNGKELNDSGRISVSHRMEDLGAFKTPSLRNISVTAPYMHNGMFKTLDEVIDFYNNPSLVVPNAINRDTILAKPLGLTPKEKQEIRAFLLSLTDKRFDNAAQ